MKITVDVELTKEQEEEAMRHAHIHDLAGREEPRKPWGKEEKRRVVRNALRHLLLQQLTREP